jgi:putative ABC transport system substrate-binding protein
MNRRNIIALLGGAAAWPIAARAQALPVVGFLNGQSPTEYAYYVAAFRQALNGAGFIEGRNVAIEYRWAEGQYDRLPTLAIDLVRRPVTVIVATGATAAVLAAKAATTIIPIVFTTGVDPVKMGLVQSLNRPGGNITGVTFMGNEAGSKKLELLREMVPRATSVGLLVNPANPIAADGEIADVQKAARLLGRQIEVVNASSEKEINAAFATLAQQRANAVIVSADGLFIDRRDQLAALAARYSLPAIYPLPEQAKAGGLISYGASQVDMYRQAGAYVGRILRGEKPADLPVMLPTKFELVINLKAAKTLGIEVPPSLSALADEVIE